MTKKILIKMQQKKKRKKERKEKEKNSSTASTLREIHIRGYFFRA